MKTVTIDRNISFGDCDPAGSVYAPNYGHFALQAVHEALDVWLTDSSVIALTEDGVLMPVRYLEVDYVSPMSWGQLLKMHVSLDRIGEHSMHFVIKGTSKQKDVFVAKIALVTLNKATKKKMPLPSLIRRCLGEG
ncbi:acyl-CoA thioesterase [Thalassotalea aquiviva]|uniref:acyl-CoA thioesterase n=1 Tax=Thalassotalea aquiviva TaxID=3242415 RepID=UPI00352ADC05